MKSLIRDYAVQNLQKLCLQLYSRWGAAFVQYLDGEFRGFIFDKIKNKVFFNRTVLGAFVLGQEGYQLSPFMTTDFAISLPPEWKIHQAFYIKWLNTKCPAVAKFPWERTLVRPTAPWNTIAGDKIAKRLHKYANLLVNNPLATSMYPYKTYHKNSEQLQQFYKDYVDEIFYRLDEWPELRPDAEMLFSRHNIYYRRLAVNNLSTFKLF